MFSGNERIVEIVLKPGNQRKTVRVKYS